MRASFREAVPQTGRRLAANPRAPEAAIAKSYNTAGPGYLAYVPGGGVYASASPSSSPPPRTATWACGAAPVLAQIEETAGRWLATLIGLPAGARGLLTSGGSLDLQRDRDRPRRPARGDRRTRDLYLSDETYHCVPKAARLAGLPPGAASVRCPPTSGSGSSPAPSTRPSGRDRAAGPAALPRRRNVGTTNTGAVDPARDPRVAREHGLWVHADAAYGGFFRLAREARSSCGGIEECDSVTLDPAQGPLPAVRPRSLSSSATARRSPAPSEGRRSYVQDVADEGSLGFADLSPELSRDFRGLRLWLPLVLHGVAAFREQLGEKLSLARWAYETLREDQRFELLDEPQLSIVAFRPARRNTRTSVWVRSCSAASTRDGGCSFSSTRIGGRYAARICVLASAPTRTVCATRWCPSRRGPALVG